MTTAPSRRLSFFDDSFGDYLPLGMVLVGAAKGVRGV